MAVQSSIGRSSYAQVPIAGVVHGFGRTRCDEGRRVQSARHGREALADAGGTLDEFYFTFGEDDVITIVDLPDHASVAALSMTIGASGAASVKTTVLLTPEEIDQRLDARCRTGRPAVVHPRFGGGASAPPSTFDSPEAPARIRRGSCRGASP